MILMLLLCQYKYKHSTYLLLFVLPLTFSVINYYRQRGDVLYIFAPPGGWAMPNFYQATKEVRLSVVLHVWGGGY